MVLPCHHEIDITASLINEIEAGFAQLARNGQLRYLSKEDKRAGESISIENQRKILTKYVQEQGWSIYDTYIDDGISGTTFDRCGSEKNFHFYLDLLYGI